MKEKEVRSKTWGAGDEENGEGDRQEEVLMLLPGRPLPRQPCF